MPTFRDIAIELKLRPGFASLTEARGVELVRRAHREICAMIPELSRIASAQPYSFALVSQVREYDLRAGLVQVDAVAIGQAPSEIAAVRAEDLNASDPNWRTRTAQSPTAYYVHGVMRSYTVGQATLHSLAHVIGFVPLPSGTALPSVTIHGAVASADNLDVNASTPDALDGVDVYLAFAGYLAAFEVAPSLVQDYYALRQIELARAAALVRTRIERLKGGVVRNIRT